MTDIYPLILQPRYVERIWGGHNLASKLHKPAPIDKKIGESWEVYEENTVVNGTLAGRTIAQLRAEMGRDLTGSHVSPDELFPLLTKLIDAQDVLSVQVHPDDAFARRVEHQPYGKTECWYIIDAAPQSQLIYGFSRDTSPDEYTRLVAEGTLDRVLRSITVQPGDMVYLPAGMVHAIGAGIVLYEVQQTSDVTYRIYDWNRKDANGNPRELHVDKARQVLDYRANTRGPVSTLHQPNSPRTMLVAGQYFCLERVNSVSAISISTYDSPVAVLSLDEPLTLRVGRTEEVTVPAYSSALIPAAAGSYMLAPVGDAVAGRAIIAYVPPSQDTVRAELRARDFDDGTIDAFLAQFTR